jgi:hypothetical protein
MGRTNPASKAEKRWEFKDRKRSEEYIADLKASNSIKRNGYPIVKQTKLLSLSPSRALMASGADLNKP